MPFDNFGSDHLGVLAERKSQNSTRIRIFLFLRLSRIGIKIVYKNVLNFQKKNTLCIPT